MVGATEVPIWYQKVKPVVCWVILQSDTDIEPGTEQIVGGRQEIRFERNSGSLGIIAGMKTVRKNKEVCVGCSLVVPKNGDTPVRVANFTDGLIKLPTGHVIGFYHPLKSVNGQTLSVQADTNPVQDPQPKCSNQTVDTESEGKGCEKLKAEKENDNKPDIQFDKSDISDDQQERFQSMIYEFSDILSTDNSDLGKTSLSEHTIDTAESPGQSSYLQGVHLPIRGK